MGKQKKNDEPPPSSDDSSNAKIDQLIASSTNNDNKIDQLITSSLETTSDIKTMADTTTKSISELKESTLELKDSTQNLQKMFEKFMALHSTPTIKQEPEQQQDASMSTTSSTSTSTSTTTTPDDTLSSTRIEDKTIAQTEATIMSGYDKFRVNHDECFQDIMHKDLLIAKPDTPAMYYSDTHKQAFKASVQQHVKQKDSYMITQATVYIHFPDDLPDNPRDTLVDIARLYDPKDSDLADWPQHDMHHTKPSNIRGKYAGGSWAMSSSAGIRQSEFKQALTKLTLSDDSLQSMKRFYDGFCNALNSATRVTQDVLPSFKDLHPSFNPSEAFIPRKPHSYYSSCKNQYQQVGRLLLAHLQDPKTIPVTNAPQSSNIISLHQADDDGFNLLFVLLRSRCPHLGGPPQDTIQHVNSLQVHPQETLLEFTTRALTIQGEINLQPHFPLPNELIAQHLRQLIQTDNARIASLVGPYLLEFEKWYRTNSHKNTKYEGTDVQQIVTSLIQAGIPQTTVIRNHTEVQPTTSLQTWSSPQIANISSSLTPPPPTTLQLEGLTDEQLTKLEHQAPQHAPIIAAVRQRRQANTTQCEACGSIGHDPERCFFRGPAFHPPDKSKRAQQYNLTHGDRPKTPPKASIKTSPPQVQFSSSPKPKIVHISAISSSHTATELETRRLEALGDGDISSDDQQRYDNLNELLTSIQSSPSDEPPSDDQSPSPYGTPDTSNDSECSSHALDFTQYTTKPKVNNLQSSSSSSHAQIAPYCAICSSPDHPAINCPELVLSATSDSTFLSDDYDMQLSASQHQAFGVKE